MPTHLVFTCYIFPRNWRVIFVEPSSYANMSPWTLFPFALVAESAWSLKFYTNQAYNLYMKEPKVGFGSGRKASVWLQHGRSCKWYFSCRSCQWKTKNNHLTQGQRAICLNQITNIYLKKVIFFKPAKTPVLLKCLFISRMTTCEHGVISKWTKWSKYVLPLLVSRVPTLDFSAMEGGSVFFFPYQDCSLIY